jgi:PII-like signaling protein
MNGDCLKLTTYFGERDRTPDGLLSHELMDAYEGHAVQASILLCGAEGFVRRLRQADAAGATCLRGIGGFHGDHTPHGDKLLQIRRQVPVCTIAIDTPERTARSFQIIDELTSDHGLVTSEMVPAVAAMSQSETRGGLRLANLDF